MTISILFTVGAIATDIGALVEYGKLPEEIKSYFNNHSDSASLYLYMVPITMLGFDFLSLVLFIYGPYLVVAHFNCKCCKNSRRDKHVPSTANQETSKCTCWKCTQKSDCNCLCSWIRNCIKKCCKYLCCCIKKCCKWLCCCECM